MSYLLGVALQEALFQRLSADVALSALVGTDIYDALPTGPLPGLYVTLGPERLQDASDMTGGGALHDVTVSVVSAAAGFSEAKAVAAAVCAALVDADLSLSQGTLVGLWFHRGRARRGPNNAGRQIDLIFRARLDEN
nr:DUF3168 domain-containing protein [uncultured Celeribacter sp.]